MTEKLSSFYVLDTCFNKLIYRGVINQPQIAYIKIYPLTMEMALVDRGLVIPIHPL